MQQFFAVVVVLLALWGTVWVLRKKGLAFTTAPLLRRNQAYPIELLNRVRLTPQHSIHLLRVEGRKLLIAVHPQGVTVLSEGAQDDHFSQGAAGR